MMGCANVLDSGTPLRAQQRPPGGTPRPYITKEEGTETEDSTVDRRDEDMNVKGRLGAIFQADQTKDRRMGRIPPLSAHFCFR